MPVAAVRVMSWPPTDATCVLFLDAAVGRAQARRAGGVLDRAIDQEVALRAHRDTCCVAPAS